MAGNGRDHLQRKDESQIDGVFKFGIESMIEVKYSELVCFQVQRSVIIHSLSSIRNRWRSSVLFRLRIQMHLLQLSKGEVTFHNQDQLIPLY